MFTLTRCLQTSDTPAMLPVFICRLVMGGFSLRPGLISYLFLRTSC